MSLPITAVGPLKVETKPILMESAATAGVASARTVAPASQNAVLILLPSSLPEHPVNDLPCCSGALRSVFRTFFFVGDVFCARNRRSAASMNQRLSCRTFGSMQVLYAP